MSSVFKWPVTDHGEVPKWFIQVDRKAMGLLRWRAQIRFQYAGDPMFTSHTAFGPTRRTAVWAVRFRNWRGRFISVYTERIPYDN